MSCGKDKVYQIIAAAEAEGRSTLYEHEVYSLLEHVGLNSNPNCILPVSGEPDFSVVAKFSSPKLVLKAVSPYLAHKSDVGGVQMVEATAEAVREAYYRMLSDMPIAYRRLIEQGAPRPSVYQGLEGKALEAAFTADLKGLLLTSLVSYDQLAMGGELFMGLRWTREFGYIITAGAGGVDTELYAGAFKSGHGVAIASADLTSPEQFLELFAATVFFKKATGRTRMQRRLIADKVPAEIYSCFQKLAHYFNPETNQITIEECEVNPFIISGGKAVAVDGLCRFKKSALKPVPRPAEKIKNLLEPKSIVVYGASAKGMNVGRIILHNILNEGFPIANICVIKEGLEELDGVKCYPSLKAVPNQIDLGVLAVSAPQIPEIIEDVVAQQKIESLILIPGGMGEKSGGATLEHRIREAVIEARATAWRGPILNGGNCLGIQSRPGRYDTLFIPKNKLPSPLVPVGQVALISQSGAFMITRISNLQRLNPVFSISTGNQIDLTVSDYLRFCLDDERIGVIAVYVEGFREQDGLEFALLARQAIARGKDVVVYKAGRTPEGRMATSGHTASIAGDYSVCEAVLKNVGVMVANTFDEFGALIRTAACLRGRKPQGWRLGAISNAGYETVGMADNIKGDDYQFSFGPLAANTQDKITKALAKSKINALVDIHNPLDITPMADDAIYAETTQAMLEDEAIDLVMVGIVPLSQAMATLAANDKPERLITSENSLAKLFPALFKTTTKPLIAVIDSGPLFDPLADAIESEGVPTFRSADLALKIVGRWTASKLKQT